MTQTKQALAANPEKNTISITIALLLNSLQAFGALMNQPLRASIAYRLRSLAKEIDQALELYNEERLALCRKYGTFYEEENLFEFGDNEEAFARELADLQSETVSFSAKTLALFDLGNAEISGAALVQLSWLIPDPEPEPTGNSELSETPETSETSETSVTL